MAGEALVKIMSNVAKNAIPKTERTDLVNGLVTSKEPLKVLVESTYEIEEDFLLLSPFCVKTEITIPTPDAPRHKHIVPEITIDSQASGEDGHTHSVTIPEQESIPDMPKIMLWRGLEVGDQVRMLRIDSGQKFYVLDRGGNYNT